ncbi:MAG: HAD family phosphatase, partial [Bacteroidales bacterium]|nr:HAD family phosphatase [Bacteroidales bacterium]
DTFLERYGIKLPDQEKIRKIHGKYNQDIFKALFSKPISESQTEEYISEKEGIYQSLCLQSDIQLAPGATDFLDFLSDNSIPFTIATASGIENVDFYFEHLGLSRYFDPSKVIYNDGTFPGKPNPRIFQKAMEKLEITAGETLIFEDSIAGIISAENAGAGKIIIVDSNGEDYSRWNYQVIKDFSEVKKSVFVK